MEIPKTGVEVAHQTMVDGLRQYEKYLLAEIGLLEEMQKAGYVLTGWRREGAPRVDELSPGLAGMSDMFIGDIVDEDGTVLDWVEWENIRNLTMRLRREEGGERFYRWFVGEEILDKWHAEEQANRFAGIVGQKFERRLPTKNIKY